MKKGVVAFVSLEFLVLVQALLAHRDHFLTVWEMQSQGISEGLPFVWHLGMWSDFLLISPLVAILIVRYAERWTLSKILSSTVIGLLAAIGMSWVYSLGNIAETHIHIHQLTGAGYVHALYMTATITSFILFYVFTPYPSGRLLLWVSCTLIAHLLLGTHIVLGVINQFVDLSWYPDSPIRSPLGWGTVLVLAAGIFGRTAHALRCSC